jgi:hypothetical protein
MKELTFEEFCNLPLTYYFGTNGDAGCSRLYRNNDFKFQKEVHTKRKKKGDIYSGWKEPIVVYFLDNDDREFTTVDQLYVAYMEKVCQIKSN